MISPLSGRFRTRPHTIALTLCFLGVFTSSAVADIRVCTWNLLQFSSGSVGSDATRIAAYQTVLSAIDPDILIVQEISNSSAVSLLLNQILNGAGGPGGAGGTPEHYSAATFTDTGDNLDQALFYRDDLFSEISASYVSIGTSPRDTPRWRLRPLSEPSGNSDLYIYSMHLSATDATSRSIQTNIVRSDANALPAGSNIFYVGDFNIDASSEASYLNLVGSQADNDGQGFDPINQGGNWSSNSSFAAIHTQSPHSNNSGAPGGATGGGLDDRFDFLLISAALQDAAGVDYLSGTYRAFGNDGLHFNMDINDSPTIPEGMAIANALHSASDHLPVYLDLSEPADLPTISVAPSGVITFGPGLVGAVVERVMTIQNTASPPGIDLEFSFNVPTGFVSLSGNGPFMLSPGQSADFTFRRLTTTAGVALGQLQVLSNDANQPIVPRSFVGTVLNHARPSTNGVSQILTDTVTFEAVPNTTNDTDVSIFNFGYVPGSSVPLEVYDAVVENDASGRFSLPSFAPTNNVTNEAIFTVRFDGVGAVPGVFTSTIRFLNRDDSTAIGAINLSDITYDFEVTVPNSLVLGDFNNSGDVELGDIPGMVALLLDPVGASLDDQAIGDMNQDTVNDSADIPGFVQAMLN